jgi:hypothetical protein
MGKQALAACYEYADIAQKGTIEDEVPASIGRDCL